MSQKRKFEEYHDPDYPLLSTTSQSIKKCKPEQSQEIQSTERTEKIKTIIKREFQKELVQKDQEINKIEHKLLQSKRLLQRVRYAVVFSFYSKKNLEYSQNELRQELSKIHSDTNEESSIPIETVPSQVLPPQKAIHPSLKKLLGKKPIDYNEILKIRGPRQAAQTAKSTITGKLRSKKDERKLRKIPTETVTNHEEPVVIFFNLRLFIFFQFFIFRKCPDTLNLQKLRNLFTK